MPARITGVVFDDVNSSGSYDPGEPGIVDAYVVAEDPNGTCIVVQTDGTGTYIFDNLTVAGDYIIYETVVDPGATCPPTTFGQPSGFTNNTTFRTGTVNVTASNISGNVTKTGPDFGHDVGTTIPCTPLGYQVVNGSLYTQNLVSGESKFLCDLGVSFNALAYNEVDGYLYGMIVDSNRLIRIDGDCNVTEIGRVPNLNTIGYNTGSMDQNGYYYITLTRIGRYYAIDLTDPNSPTWGQLVDPTAGYVLDPTGNGTVFNGVGDINISDWTNTMTDGFIYGLVDGNGNLRRVDPTTGDTITIPTTGTSSNGKYGAAFADAEGYMYFINNGTGKLYKVETDGVTATGVEYAQAEPASENDGANCISATIEIDYGDAPDISAGNGPGDYSTLLANNGPRHQIGINTLFLGTQVTAETDAYQSSDALGDDQVQGIQDDATTLPLPIVVVNSSSYSLDITVTNETGEDANLYAWVDFNQDGIFQTNEGFTTTVPSQLGTQTVPLTFTIPPSTTLVPGDTFVRIRITTETLDNTGGITEEDTRSLGPAGDGEVEDYLVSIERFLELTLTKSADLNFADVGDVLTYTILVDNTGGEDIVNINFIDTISDNLAYVSGSLTVDGVPNGGDLNTGVSLSDLAPGEDHLVEFQVTVVSIGPPNPVPNEATANFEDIGGSSYSVNSNIFYIQINNADLIGDNGENFVKSVDKEFADVGEVLTYSFSIENTGNVVASNIVLTDVIPNDTTFVAGSVVVNGGVTGDNPETGISIADIDANETATVSFQVTVDTIPTPNPIPDTGNLAYEYIVDPANPPVSDSGASNTVTTQVNHADLIGDNGDNFVKSVDKEFADVGEVLTYSFSIENTGNVDAINIVLTDTIPNDTTFISGSLLVNGTPSGDNPELGINIPDIGSGEIATVSFQVTVDTIPATNPIPDTGDLSYEYIVDPANPPASGSGDSNTVSTQVNHADLIGDNGENFVKSVDRESAAIGDILTYTFDIENTGNVAAINVILTDIISNDTIFIPDSVLVNGVSSGDDPNTGISIPSIAAGGSATVEFQVRVDKVPDPNPIPDTGSIAYGYTVNPADPPVNSSGDSNTVTTQVNYADLIGDNGENFVKSVDREYADLGDVLVYSISIENTGNVPAIDIVLTDIIPSETTLIPDSVVVNGVLSADDPSEGIAIPDINAGESATVSFQVRVDELPEVNPIPDTGSIDYAYKADPDGNPVRDGGDSNTVSTQVNHADLIGDEGENFVKSSTPEYVDLGDIITYTFNIENTGNTTAENIVLTDPIPNGTSYVDGSLLVNGMATGDNPELGINIPDIGSGETGIVSFEVLVEEIPVPNPIPNTGSIEYGYRVDPLLPLVEGGGDSNTVLNQVNHADLLGENGENFVKSVAPEVAEVGDEVTYSYTIENTGNEPAINVVLVDPLPSSVTFVEGSILIDGVPLGDSILASEVLYSDSPASGIDLPDIGAGETVTVSFRVRVDEVPVPNPMTNIGSIAYDYLVNPGDSPVSAGGNSNEAELQVEVVDLEVLKSVDKAIAIAGEKLMFTITISNNGTIRAENVIFTDSIPEGTTFVEDSLILDGVSQIGANPASGIDVGDIAADAFVIVTFKVSIDDPVTANPIVNQCSIDYQVQVDPNAEIDDRTEDSNAVEVDIERGEISIVKMIDRELAKLGDMIIYTLVVTNTGTVRVENVVITDELDLSLEFVENSVRINDAQIVGVDPNKGINIGDIEPGEEVLISFQVEVVEISCILELGNIASGEFEFNLEGREEIFTGSAESNEVSIDINVKIFKQISVDETLKIPSQKPDIEDVLDVEVSVEIINTTVISTPVTRSYEGQNLRGNKIIVEGILKQLVSYIADREEQDVHAAHFEVPFSTFLVVPDDFNLNQRINVNYLIEDVYIELLDPRTIFKNVTLLLRVNDSNGNNGC